LIVLGVHLFDLMRFFAGDALWCSARVLQNGHDITLQDAHAASEKIGPVAGDDIIAGFGFTKGVYASFTSRSRNREAAGPWGMELIGTKGSVRILTEINPKIHMEKRGGWTAQGSTREWRPWEKDPTLSLPDSEKGVASANGRVVDDWLGAI